MVWWKFTDISEKRPSSIFGVRKDVKQGTRLDGLLFNPKDGGSSCLGDIRKLSLFTRRHIAEDSSLKCLCLNSPFYQMDRENACNSIFFVASENMRNARKQRIFTLFCPLLFLFTRFNFSLCSRSSFSHTVLCLIHLGIQVCLCLYALHLHIFCSVWRVLPYCAG